MDINEAVGVVEALLARHQLDGRWRGAELRVRPSGDDADHIKVWLGLADPTDEEGLEAVREEVLRALAAAPDLADFTIEVRAEAV